MRHPEYDGHCTRYWHHRTDTNSLQPDIQTQYHGNYELVLLYHSTTETAALHPQLNTDQRFPMYPSYCITSMLPLLSPQTGTAKSFCSVILSHLLSLQNKLTHADVFTSRWCTEKSHPHLGTSPPLPHCTDPFPPLSECLQLFRLLCSSHNPAFLPWLVFTRLPSKTRYGWVLLVCFLHFTVANCNLNLPAKLINLYATTVNTKFHGIFLLSFCFCPQKWSNRIRPEEAG